MNELDQAFNNSQQIIALANKPKVINPGPTVDGPRKPSKYDVIIQRLDKIDKFIQEQRTFNQQMLDFVKRQEEFNQYVLGVFKRNNLK